MLKPLDLDLASGLCLDPIVFLLPKRLVQSGLSRTGRALLPLGDDVLWKSFWWLWLQSSRNKAALSKGRGSSQQGVDELVFETRGIQEALVTLLQPGYARLMDCRLEINFLRFDTAVNGERVTHEGGKPGP